MGIHSIILYIMLAGSIIGGIDRLFGNKLGLGEKFEEGFNAMGPIALAIVGIVSLAPVLANLVKPIVSPILKIFGADPAMAAAIIANDMGGIFPRNSTCRKPASRPFFRSDCGGNAWLYIGLFHAPWIGVDRTGRSAPFF